VSFASGAITFYEGNNMLSALEKYMINRLMHGLFHIALVSVLVICPVFALRVYALDLPSYSTSGICVVVSKIICQSTRKDDA
jgi:hypothetical protein